MSQIVIIKMDTIGEDVESFDIYTDADSYTNPIETDIPRSLMLTGFTSSLVPDGATSVKAVIASGVCTGEATIAIDTSQQQGGGTIAYYWVLNACNPLYPAASTQIPPDGLNQRYIIPNLEPIYYVWNNNDPKNYPAVAENTSLQKTPLFGCP